MLKFLVSATIELSGLFTFPPAVASLVCISAASEGARYPCFCKKEMLACVWESRCDISAVSVIMGVLYEEDTSS